MVEEGPWLTDKYWVTHYNFLDEVKQQFTLPDHVYIHEVTLREAEQAPYITFYPEEKLRIAQALDEMGVDSIEIFPVISNDDMEVARQLTKTKLNAKIVFLCRWEEKEVDFAIEAGADAVMVEALANPWAAQALWGMSEDAIIKKLTKVVAHAKKNGIFTRVMPWDDFRAPLSFLERLYKSLVFEGGADQVTISDTFGQSLPWATVWIIRKLKDWVPGIPIEVHGHNDFGLATTVMLSAVIGGASIVHTSTNALGERAGNAATDEVVTALELLLGVNTGVKLDRLYSVSQLVAELAKTPVARNKPVIGDNEFTYESGMVVYLIEHLLKTGRAAAGFPFLPEVIGRKGYKVILGKMTGATVIAEKLKELGLSATQEQIGEIVERVKREGIIRKWAIPDDAFEDIVRQVLH